MSRRGCGEDALSVASSAEGGVDEDPATFQRREEEREDFICECGVVSRVHKASMRQRPNAFVARASIPITPPTEVPESARRTNP
jgi:hypothetical protein